MNSGLVNDCSAHSLAHLFGKGSLIVLNHCNFALPGSHFIGSYANSYLNTISEISPELASILKEGLHYPELSVKLTELTREIVNLKNARANEKPSIVKKVANSLDDIKKISEGVECLKPYAKVLCNGIKALFGFDFLDW